MAEMHGEVTHRTFSNTRSVTQSKAVDLIPKFHQSQHAEGKSQISQQKEIERNGLGAKSR